MYRRYCQRGQLCDFLFALLLAKSLLGFSIRIQFTPPGTVEAPVRRGKKSLTDCSPLKVYLFVLHIHNERQFKLLFGFLVNLPVKYQVECTYIIQCSFILISLFNMEVEKSPHKSGVKLVYYD